MANLVPDGAGIVIGLPEGRSIVIEPLNAIPVDVVPTDERVWQETRRLDSICEARARGWQQMTDVDGGQAVIRQHRVVHAAAGMDANGPAFANINERLNAQEAMIAHINNAVNFQFPTFFEAVLHALHENNIQMDAIGAQMNAIGPQMNEMNGRMDAIDVQMNTMNGQMNTMNGQMNAMNGRMDAIDVQMNAMNGRMNAVENQMNGQAGQMNDQTQQMNGQTQQMAQLNGQMQGLNKRFDLAEARTNSNVQRLVNFSVARVGVDWSVIPYARITKYRPGHSFPQPQDQIDGFIWTQTEYALNSEPPNGLLPGNCDVLQSWKRDRMSQEQRRRRMVALRWFYDDERFQLPPAEEATLDWFIDTIGAFLHTPS